MVCNGTWLINHIPFVNSAILTIGSSDRPKFGLVPVPAEILTGTEFPVSVKARFRISVQFEPKFAKYFCVA